MLLSDTIIDKAILIAKIFKSKITKNKKYTKNNKLSASIDIVKYLEKESMRGIINRVDKLVYSSKIKGKKLYKLLFY